MLINCQAKREKIFYIPRAFILVQSALLQGVRSLSRAQISIIHAGADKGIDCTILPLQFSFLDGVTQSRKGAQSLALTLEM